MAITLAALAALLFGASDLFAARAGRSFSSLAVTRTAVAASALVATVGALVQRSPATGRDLLIGGASGLAMIGGIAVLYFGYSNSRMSLVAPVCAVATGGIPVLAAALVGDRLSAATVAGVVVGLCAVALVSLQPSEAHWDRWAFLLGAGSGLLFGAAFLLMGLVSSDAGLAPVAAQRATGLLLLTCIWAVRRGSYATPAGRVRRQAVLAGLLATGAVISLQSAFQVGALGPVAVVGSQFVTVAVLLAIVVEREPVRWWQGIGIAGTAVSVALLAAG